jgi:hypothetical protein
MISPRYLPAVAILVAVTLVPTVVHSYIGYQADDGRTSDAVATRLDGIDGIDTHRNPEWVRDTFQTGDFVERRYGPDVTLSVARAYDAKRLYHHPELGLAYARVFDSTMVVRASSSVGPVPVHVLLGDSDMAAYALLYEGEFVTSPARFEISHALKMLVGPARPMTLFFARGSRSATPETSPVMRILVAGIESFLASPAR